MMIDLRSDTVTCPDPAMRKAMMTAEVGDDVFGEDSNVRRLEEEVAGLLGMEAGLYVPSGTMSNQLAIKVHTRPGDEIICEEGAHVYNYEAAGPAFHSQVQVRPIKGQLGVITADEVTGAIRTMDVHNPPSRLVVIENTHNRAGGAIFPLDEIGKIRQVADEHSLIMHMDGARLMNAVVASGIAAHQWAKPFESVSFCLSKGLGAPVGSVLCGSRDFIREAHRFRKILGGGMRQAGIIAAGGLYALKHNVADLAKDHQRAQKLAQALNEMDGITIDPAHVHTNIVIFTIDGRYGTAPEVVERLGAEGLACFPFDSDRIRLVTHRDLDDTHIEGAVTILGKVFA